MLKQLAAAIIVFIAFSTVAAGSFHNFTLLGVIIFLLTIFGLEKRSREEHAGKAVGIDGWLFLFILSMFATPLLGYLAYLVNINTLFVDVSILEGIFISSDLIIFGFQLYIAINLWKQNPKSVNWAKILILISVTSAALYALYINNLDTTDYYRGFVFDVLIKKAIYTLIWLPYLFFSKRVKNTYKVNSKKISIPKLSIIVMGIFIILSSIRPLIFIFFQDEIAMGIALNELDSISDSSCQNYCLETVDDLGFHVTDLTEIDDNYNLDCYCYNQNNELIESKSSTFGKEVFSQ